MQPTDLLYINLLKNTDAKEATSTVLTPEEQQTISALALRHYTSPLLLPYINEPQLHEQLKQQTKQMILNYHQIAHFTFLVTSLLDDHQIPYILLKGISLAACYPQPEFRKLGDVDIYISDPDALKRAKKLLLKLNAMSGYEEECRSVLEELIPGIPASATICPPFCCDHGDGIRLGEHVFINSNCTFLDGGYITVGAYTLIGPCVQIYTPQHPFDYLERRVEQEYAYPVTIGEDCWIGGGAVICPGVTIGDRCIIGAGSVVTKDIPSDCVAVGNPAKVIRKNDIKK